jgi:anti-sigma factor RsiW
MNAVCGHDRELIASLVLGGLDDERAQVVAGWVATCASCRAEHAALAPLPGLLDLAAAPGPRAPSRVRDRVLAAAVRRRARQRWSAVVATAALVAGLAGIGVGQRLPGPPSEVGVTVAAVDPFEATGSVAFRSDGERLRVGIVLEGLDELDAPAVYEAWLYRADGRIVSIGQLDVVDGRVNAELSADGPPQEYVGFWVTAEPDRRDPAHDGPTVVRTTVPHW